MISKFANISLTFFLAIFLSGCGNKDVALNEFKDGKIVLWRNQLNGGMDVESNDCVEVLKLSNGFLEFAIIKNDSFVWLDYWGGGASQKTRVENVYADKIDGRITELKLLSNKIKNETLEVKASNENYDIEYFFKQLNRDVVLDKLTSKPKNTQDQSASKEQTEFKDEDKAIYKACKLKDLGALILQGNQNLQNHFNKSQEVENSESERNNGAKHSNNSNGKTVPSANPFPYMAVISCGMNGWENINVYGCFSGQVDTELELRNGNDYGLYKLHNIAQSFKQTRNGLEILLKPSFELTAQNSDDVLKLGVRIIDLSSGEVLFQKQVGRFGVIRVSN